MGVFLLSAEKDLVKYELTFGMPHGTAQTLVFALLSPAFKGTEEGRWMVAVQKLMWAE